MMSMWTLRSLAVLSALLILEAPRCSMALPKSWIKGVHPKEESASEIDHSAAAAAAQDLMDQLDTGASLDDLLDNGDSSDEGEESMQNLETPALKTREYNPVDPPYGQNPTYGKDPYCRTYYDYVYDKKCKDYKDKVCYTTYSEYC